MTDSDVPAVEPGDATMPSDSAQVSGEEPVQPDSPAPTADGTQVTEDQQMNGDWVPL